MGKTRSGLGAKIYNFAKSYRVKIGTSFDSIDSSLINLSIDFL